MATPAALCGLWTSKGGRKIWKFAHTSDPKTVTGSLTISDSSRLMVASYYFTATKQQDGMFVVRSTASDQPWYLQNTCKTFSDMIVGFTICDDNETRLDRMLSQPKSEIYTRQLTVDTQTCLKLDIPSTYYGQLVTTQTWTKLQSTS